MREDGGEGESGAHVRAGAEGGRSRAVAAFCAPAAPASMMVWHHSSSQRHLRGGIGSCSLQPKRGEGGQSSNAYACVGGRVEWLGARSSGSVLRNSFSSSSSVLAGSPNLVAIGPVVSPDHRRTLLLLCNFMCAFA